MRAATDRSRRFDFDSIADAYVSARPVLPLAAVVDAAAAMRLRRGARVLEVGAGGGELTAPLVEAGFDVVALEPGQRLRRRARERVPSAEIRPEAFEEFEPHGRFEAVFSANAFHWIDPDVAYSRAADVADVLVLIWDTPFPADAVLFRRIQHEVLWPRGSTFPDDAAGVRELVDADSAAGREELLTSERFDDPWWRVYERKLAYTAARYVELVGSMSGLAAAPERDAVLAELRAVVGDDPLDVIDIVYVVAARAKAA